MLALLSERHLLPVYLTFRFILPLSVLLLLSQMAIRLKNHTTREDVVTRVTRFPEVLRNLPPLPSISCSRREWSPAAVPPAFLSLENTTTLLAPMAQVHSTIGYSLEETIGVHKRSLARRPSVLEGGNSSGGITDKSYGGLFPMEKRRRIPLCRSWTASAIPTMARLGM